MIDFMSNKHLPPLRWSFIKICSNLEATTPHHIYLRHSRAKWQYQGLRRRLLRAQRIQRTEWTLPYNNLRQDQHQAQHSTRQDKNREAIAVGNHHHCISRQWAGKKTRGPNWPWGYYTVELNQKGKKKDMFCESSSKRKVEKNKNEEVKDMPFSRNLMADLEEAWDKEADSSDEEVVDPKTVEKHMPLGTFIGSEECCLGTRGLPATQNKEVATFFRSV